MPRDGGLPGWDHEDQPVDGASLWAEYGWGLSGRHAALVLVVVLLAGVLLRG